MRAILPALLLLALAAPALPFASADTPECDADPSIFLRPPNVGLDASCEAAGYEVFSLDVDGFFTCYATVLGHDLTCYER